MQSTNENIQRLIKALNDSGICGRGCFATIAKKTGFTASYVGQVFTGKKMPGTAFVTAVCNAFGINCEWVNNAQMPVYHKMPIVLRVLHEPTVVQMAMALGVPGNLLLTEYIMQLEQRVSQLEKKLNP